MFLRLTSITVAALIVAVLAATAFATDTPPTDQPTVAPSINTLQSVLNKCTDNTRPHSAISAKEAKTASHSRVLRGTARDKGCGVALVTIAISKKHGKLCQFLTTSGRLGHARKCTPTQWLTAPGTKNWKVGLDRLGRGRYEVRIRAIDLAGNIERSHGRTLDLR
jgi:hypothetical protein